MVRKKSLVWPNRRISPWWEVPVCRCRAMMLGLTRPCGGREASRGCPARGAVTAPFPLAASSGYMWITKAGLYSRNRWFAYKRKWKKVGHCAYFARILVQNRGFFHFSPPRGRATTNLWSELFPSGLFEARDARAERVNHPHNRWAFADGSALTHTHTHMYSMYVSACLLNWIHVKNNAYNIMDILRKNR